MGNGKDWISLPIQKYLDDYYITEIKERKVNK